ncbi:hypothetical protein pEaSNUABM29_00001 [Erwinia phage pEa_SNUABM_29]|nr:hypothetical protein pEaSNUABM29_00001 [Erwinia phage pEa_SNUABM_29]
MAYYTESALQQLCQQVVRDNPDLAGRISPDTIGVNGSPVFRNLNGRNSQVTLIGKPGKGFIGELVVSYDRLSLPSLFTSAALTLVLTPEMITLGDLLPSINELYGINIERADVALPDTVLPRQIGVGTVSLTVQNTALCYTGRVTVSYTSAPYGNYPDSGPGPKQLLAGDNVFGYFGKVSQQEFFTGYEMWNGLSPNGAPGFDTSFTWLKFFMNGKVTYLPSRGIGGTTWQNLYKYGAVFGTDGPGKVPGATTPVNQLLYMAKTFEGKARYFQLRCPWFNASLNLVGNWDDASALKLVSLINKNTASGGWGQESGLVFSDYVHMQEHDTGTLSLRMAINGGYSSWISDWTTADWWPVVELIDPTGMVVPLADVTTEVTNAATWPLSSGTVKDAAITPVFITEIATEAVPLPMVLKANNNDLTVIPVGIDAPHVDIVKPMVGSANAGSGVRPIGIDSPHYTGPKPLVVKSDQSDKSSKTSLSSCNGELNGFL